MSSAVNLLPVGTVVVVASISRKGIVAGYHMNHNYIVYWKEAPVDSNGFQLDNAIVVYKDSVVKAPIGSRAE